MLKVLAQVFGVTVVLACQAEASIILHFFPVSAFNSNSSVMDATLGVTGFTEDTFETTTLISGLTIALTGGVTPTTFSGTLPTLFDQSVCPGLTDNSVWDGTHGVINTTTNTMSNCTGPANIATLATFNYAPGATSFGIGMGNFQSLSSPSFPITNHELFVNGVDQGVLETLAGANWTPGLARNAYLRVDGTGGTTITSVAFQNLTASDVLVFDHVAVSGVIALPEPSAFWPLLLITVGLPARTRYRAARQRAVRMKFTLLDWVGSLVCAAVLTADSHTT